MQKGIKFRAYPNKEQQNLINQTLGCCRLIYNKGLAMRNVAYENGSKVGYTQTSAMLTELKKTSDFAFLKEVDSIALQQSLRDLDRGFVNFFQKRASHPTFKSKHNNHQSYRTVNQGDNIRIVGKYIKLPKLGYVKIKQSMEVGKINNVTIERTPSGKYFVVLNVDFEPELQANKGGSIGIDVGIKDFYSDSNGNVVHNPKYLEKSMRKLVREQRRLSRKQKGSANREKARRKLAIACEKDKNKREDFLNKLSSSIVKDYDLIAMENLDIKSMLKDKKNKNLHKSISELGWYSFMSKVKYKAEWYGKVFVQVENSFPSSQLCSHCGHQNKEVKNLNVREWECPNCHTIHDRDRNAANNILREGKRILSEM